PGGTCEDREGDAERNDTGPERQRGQEAALKVAGGAPLPGRVRSAFARGGFHGGLLSTHVSARGAHAPSAFARSGGGPWRDCRSCPWRTTGGYGSWWYRERASHNRRRGTHGRGRGRARSRARPPSARWTKARGPVTPPPRRSSPRSASRP